MKDMRLPCPNALAIGLRDVDNAFIPVIGRPIGNSSPIYPEPLVLATPQFQPAPED